MWQYRTLQFFHVYVLMFVYFYFMCMDVLPACKYVHYMCSWRLRSEEGIGFPRTKVTDGYKLPCGARNHTRVFGRAATAPNC